MNTVFLLMAQYDGRVVIPAEAVREDYLPHLSRVKFMRKVHDGVLDLPVISIEDTQKSAKGVHVLDLAKYIEGRREKALAALQTASIAET